MAIDFIDPVPPIDGGGSTPSVTIRIDTPLTVLQGGTGAQNSNMAAHNILNLPGSAVGDLYVRSSATAISRLAPPAGSSGYVLTSNGPGVVPSYQASSGGPGGGLPLTGGTLRDTALPANTPTLTISAISTNQARISYLIDGVTDQWNTGMSPGGDFFISDSTASPAYRLDISNTGWARINGSLTVGHTGADTGAGTINAVNGVKISHNPVSPPTTAPQNPPLLWIVESDTESGVVLIDTFGANVGSVIHRHAGGTAQNPSMITANTQFGNYAWRGYDGGAGYTAGAAARISVVALEDWIDGNHRGTELSIFTVPVGTAAPVAQATFGPGVKVGSPTAPTGGMLVGDLNAHRILVDGSPLATSTAGAVSLTIDHLDAESITLDGTPLVTTSGGNAGDVLTKQVDETIAWAPPQAGLPAGGSPGDVLTKPNGSAAWARIGDPNGLVIGNPSGGALGAGTVNIEGAYYLDGEPFVGGGAAGFTQSFPWTAGVNPDNLSIYINNSGEPLTIAAVSAAVEVGATGTIQVVRADAGDLLSAGDNITDPFDVNQTAGTVDLLNIVDDDLPVNWRLGLRTTGTWPGSVGVITVYLGPPRPPLITSQLTASGTIGQAFNYQITTTSAATSFAANVPPPVGLTINTTTGLISGTPTTADVTDVTISATNAAGSNTRHLIITISDVPTGFDPARIYIDTMTPGNSAVLSGPNNRSFAAPGSIYRTGLSNTTRAAGKWYIEAVFEGNLAGIGFGTDAQDLSGGLGSASMGALLSTSDGGIRFITATGVNSVQTGIGFAVGDRIAVAIDSTAGRVWVRKQDATPSAWSDGLNTFVQPANPTAGTGGFTIANFTSALTASGGIVRIVGSSGFTSRITIYPGVASGGIGTPPTDFSWWDS